MKLLWIGRRCTVTCLLFVGIIQFVTIHYVTLNVKETEVVENPPSRPRRRLSFAKAINASIRYPLRSVQRKNEPAALTSSRSIRHPIFNRGTRWPVLQDLFYMSKANGGKISDKLIDSSLALQWINGSQYFDKRVTELYNSCKALISRDKGTAFRNCRNFTDMHFINGSRVVALPSFPGSGSTWTRMALQQATGIYTGSIYCDRVLKSQGFAGEKLSSSNVLVVKTHYPNKELFVPEHEYYDGSKFRNVTAAIFLIRNPVDSFVAQWNWKHSGHVGKLNEQSFGMCRIRT